VETHSELLAKVAKPVDQFMSDIITVDEARSYLATSCRGHFAVDTSGDAPMMRRGQWPTRSQLSGTTAMSG
jgi:hypothetical protein